MGIACGAIPLSRLPRGDAAIATHEDWNSLAVSRSLETGIGQVLGRRWQRKTRALAQHFQLA
jgi:hypothetical protein